MSNILDPIRFPLHGSRLIEASAGTGKTYTLAALYVRLVLGHGNDDGNGPEKMLLPPDILVVTFTEAATRELRERIRARLADAALCFAGRLPVQDNDMFLQQLMREYPQQDHAACAARLDAAAQWMDEAAIYTIHGFCNRMLRQHAFDSGSLFTMELKKDEQQLREQATMDYWRTFFYDMDEQCTAALLKQWPTPTQLIKAVRPMLGNQGYFSEELRRPEEIIRQITSEREAVLNDLRDRWSQWTGDLLSKFEAAWESKRLLRSKPSRSADIGKWFKKIISWLETPEQLSPELEGSVFFERINSASLSAASDKIPEIVSHPAVAAIEELRGIDQRLPDLKAALLPHAGKWISERLDQYKRAHGMIGYDDMLSRLRDALIGPHGARLAAIIRQQFPVAMIDEFQDTDPVQYQVFSTLYARQPGCAWLMIGDPKQAIYAFRGADIHTYLAARRATEDSLYTLDKNFRSAKGLVEAANHLFEYASSYPDGSFLYRDIPFTPVQANDRAERLMIDGQPCDAMTLWQLENEGDDPSMAKGQYLHEMAQRSASEIVRLLNLASSGRCGFDENGSISALRPADIAILVRDGGEAANIRAALSERGLRSVYLSDKDSVFDSTEAADLLCWLQAAAQPESEQKIRAALATSTLALSWQQLDELGQDEQKWEAKVDQFHLYHHQWQRHGVLPMIRALLRDYQVPARLLNAGDERGLTNLLHLAELAQRAAGQLDGELALVRWLAESIDSGDEDAGEDHILRLESDADLIRIVTIHKSKGLEYPLVFLPFICTFRAQDGKHLPLAFHDDDNSLRLTLTPSINDIQRAERERLAEDLRLLYVAVTRARHACWLGIAPMRIGNSKNRTDLPRSAIGYVLTGGNELQPNQLGKPLSALASDCDHIALQPAPESNQIAAVFGSDTPTLAAARSYQAPATEHWWIASYSALEPEAISAGETPRHVRDEVISEEKHQIDVLPVPAAQENSIHTFVRGPQAGTFLHGLLEWACTQDFTKLAEQRRDEFRLQLQRRCQVPGWEDYQQILDQWFGDYLQTALPFADQSLCLANLPRHQCQPEMEFWIQSTTVSTTALDQLVRRYVLPGQPRPALREDMLNGMLKGFIDLVFVDQGRYFVADYKSNWLGPDNSSYSNSAMAEAVLEKRYDVQLCLYLLALHRLLRSRLGKSYQPKHQLGGAALLFLRGLYSESRGVFFQAPISELIDALDSLFRGQPVPESADVI
ncbi:exodeoxyribonuclease V subunit beta [Alcanivorax sp. 1008]|uniref:exodeoxyribonuclease V subunit beta n=1 Tax=Alcanivorax sp. 1008 TaxID=2816853 RepID=UPI001E055104|nr:exodeoxyribonuclease V subunit beta [Alcanivorax sp. 1008]MCC1497198.1 exodeoxyribonuclease V subunit beta [Alcanivorax sp. 1008]